MGKWETVGLGDVCEVLDHMRVPVTSSERKSGVYPYYGANGIQDYVDDYIFDDDLVLLAEDGGNFGSKDRPIAYHVSGKCWVNNHAHVLKPKEMLDVNYLCYSIMFYDVMPLISGTTRAKLNQAAMRKMTIPLPPLPVQRQIADVLDRASALIEKRKAQIEKLDLLVKSQFIEMFDSADQVRKWECVNIGNVANVYVGVVIKPAQYYTEGPDGIRAFRSLNVGEMRVKDDSWVFFTPEGHKKNSKSELKENDVLVVRSGAPGMACVVTKEYAGSNAIDVIIARPVLKMINPTFLCAFTNLPHGKRQIEQGTGGAAQQHFNIGRYKDMTICLPPLPLQNQFADFVQNVETQKSLLQQSLAKMELNYKSLMQKCFRGETF